MDRQELSKIVNFVRFYEWAPIGYVCLMISEKVKQDHWEPFFPAHVSPGSKYLRIYVSIYLCVDRVQPKEIPFQQS